jgi:hypothetical protein
VAVGRQWLGDDGKVQGATRLRLLRHGGAGLSERHGAGDDQSECFHAHFPLLHCLRLHRRRMRSIRQVQSWAQSNSERSIKSPMRV